MKVPEKIRELEYEYTVDQREFGKVLVVVSATTFLISLMSLYQVMEVQESVEGVNSDFSKLDAVISSDRFNQSLSAIQSLEGTTSGQKFQYAAQTFRGMQHGLKQAEQAEHDLEHARSTYQWVILLSILGATAGVTVIYT
ncbi:MAG: hypothetical protein ABEJ93_04790 [Candidatus Nanohalobium sp.]